jgi:hypothetical protein
VVKEKLEIVYGPAGIREVLRMRDVIRELSVEIERLTDIVATQNHLIDDLETRLEETEVA